MARSARIAFQRGVVRLRQVAKIVIYGGEISKIHSLDGIPINTAVVGCRSGIDGYCLVDAAAVIGDAGGRGINGCGDKSGRI